MSRKYVGTRALGNMPPELRSTILNMSRTLRALSQSQRSSPLAQELSVTRTAGAPLIRNNSTGARAITTSAGRDVDKPSITFLQERGVSSLVYVALDTNKVYIWNGTAYKSSTFS